MEHLEAIAALARIVWRARYPGIIALEQIEYMLARMYDVRVMEEECGCGVTYDRLLVGDTLYGFASYGPIAEPGALKLHKLYVHPEVQRLKLGSALLRHVEASARGHGYATLVLAVNRKNDAAIAAYRKHGFAVRAEAVVDIGGGFVMDDYVMAKLL